jgi:MFS family permease
MQTGQRATVSTLLALLMGFGLMQMGNTLQGTLLSVRGQIESFSPAQIGAVGAGFWAGIVIGSLYCGKLIQRVGHIRAFLALGAIAAIAPLLHLLVMNPIAWVMARGLTGFCFAGLFIVVESWLNSAATDETRGQILSVYAMTGLLSGIVGQLLLPATDTAGFKPFCIVAIIIALALVPIALTRAVAPAHEGGGARISLKGLYRQSPFGLVAATLCGVTASAFFTLGPIFAQRRGLDTGGIAAFMASGTLGGFLMAWPLGWLSDRLDRRLVIIGAAVTAALTLGIMMAIVPDEATRWMLYLCAGVFGGTIIPTTAL